MSCGIVPLFDHKNEDPCPIFIILLVRKLKLALVLGPLQVLAEVIVTLGRLVFEHRHELALFVHHDIATGETSRRFKRRLVPHLTTRSNQLGVLFTLDVVKTIRLAIGTIDHGIDRH